MFKVPAATHCAGLDVAAAVAEATGEGVTVGAVELADGRAAALGVVVGGAALGAGDAALGAAPPFQHPETNNAATATNPKTLRRRSIRFPLSGCLTKRRPASCRHDVTPIQATQYHSRQAPCQGKHTITGRRGRLDNRTGVLYAPDRERRRQ
jgi:hypothetical protein